MEPEVINNSKIVCYDLARGVDRYTVVYLDQPEDRGCYACVAMSAKPFHPQGFGQHAMCRVGSHLGKIIPFAALPLDCQKLVRQDLK